MKRDINLIQGKKRIEIAGIRALRVTGLIIIISIIIIFAVTFPLKHRQTLEAKAHQHIKSASGYEGLESDYAMINSKVQSKKEKYEVLDTFFMEHRKAGGVLKQIQGCIPDTVNIVKLTLNKNFILLYGRAPTNMEAADLIHNLNKIGLFVDVYINSIYMDKTWGEKVFVIECRFDSYLYDVEG